MSKRLNGFESSEFATQIRQMVVRGKADGRDLLSMFREIKVLDPKVPNYSRFRIFAQRLEKLFEEEPKSDQDLLDRAIEKSIAIGDLVLEQTLTELKATVESGKVIPWQKRTELMKWFNDSGNMKMRQKFMDIKNKQGMASIAAMALLADAARYGKIVDKDINIIEGEITDASIPITNSVPELNGAGAGADTGTS
jgi:hypothetical protein